MVAILPYFEMSSVNDKKIKKKGYLESIDQSPKTDSPTIECEGGHSHYL
jgi:hypothetical protein